MILQKLEKQKLIHPPRFLIPNTAFLTQAGSVMYGANLDHSDIDIHGFCFPEKEMIFPHQVSGIIEGFGTQHKRFRVWQQHHVKDGESEYDFCIYNVVDFFELAFQSNPNVLELLFCPRRCIIHTTHAYEYVREHRHMFLNKTVMAKLRGYAYGQLTKAKSTPDTVGKRADDVAKYGYSAKMMSHAIRLCLQAEQILSEHDLDLERNSEIIKSIKRGEWTIERLEGWFSEKEKSLETLYSTSTLRSVPDEVAIKNILLHVIEMHYGSLDSIIQKDNSEAKLLAELESLVTRYRT